MNIVAGLKSPASITAVALAASIVFVAGPVLQQRLGASQRSPERTSLDGTSWRAIEVAGKPVPAQDAAREAQLLFQSGGRFSGSDGCNHLVGSYELKGDSLAFGAVTATEMACPNIGDLDAAFRAALKAATRLRITGDRLELFDPAGTRLAVFAARSQSALRSASTEVV